MWTDLRRLACLAVVAVCLSACRTTAPSADYRALAKAAVRLGVDIDLADHHPLYLEASRWIGTPYRHGGTTRQGVDCSGLVQSIYRQVYHVDLPRSAEAQRTTRCRTVDRRHLQEGDLVFFGEGRRPRHASHVGIYLKQGKFVHASSSQGVVVSSLDEPYYQRTWLNGGKVTH